MLRVSTTHRRRSHNSETAAPTIPRVIPGDFFRLLFCELSGACRMPQKPYAIAPQSPRRGAGMALHTPKPKTPYATIVTFPRIILIHDPLTTNHRRARTRVGLGRRAGHSFWHSPRGLQRRNAPEKPIFQCPHMFLICFPYVCRGYPAFPRFTVLPPLYPFSVMKLSDLSNFFFFPYNREP